MTSGSDAGDTRGTVNALDATCTATAQEAGVLHNILTQLQLAWACSAVGHIAAASNVGGWFTRNVYDDGGGWNPVRAFTSAAAFGFVVRAAGLLSGVRDTAAVPLLMAAGIACAVLCACAECTGVYNVRANAAAAAQRADRRSARTASSSAAAALAQHARRKTDASWATWAFVLSSAATLVLVWVVCGTAAARNARLTRARAWLLSAGTPVPLPAGAVVAQLTTLGIAAALGFTCMQLLNVGGAVPSYATVERRSSTSTTLVLAAASVGIVACVRAGWTLVDVPPPA